MTNDMTVGNPTKLIIKFIIPLLIGNIFQQLYSMVDTIIVGRFVGIDALGGVGATGSINFFVIGFVMGLTSGFSVPIAQSFGSHDYNKMRNYVMLSVYLCSIITVIITILSVYYLKPLLVAMKTPEINIDYAYNYMIIILLGLFSSVAYNMNAGILRALGDSKTPLYFLILASAINIMLDLVFIIYFKMGVMGAGLATVIAQGTSALLCIIFISKKFEILKIQKQDYKYSKKGAAYMLKIGLPMALQFSVIAIGSILLQSAVNSLGPLYVASYTVGCRIEQLAIQPFSTLGVAAATYTGQNFGAGKIDRIKKGMKSTILIGISIAFICGLIIYFFGEPIINLFMSEGESSQDVIKYAKMYLNFVSIFFIPLMLLITYRSAIQGLGDGIIPIISSVIELSARVLVSLGLVASLGYFAICLAPSAAWLGGALLLSPSYFYKIKKLKIIQNTKESIK